MNYKIIGNRTVKLEASMISQLLQENFGDSVYVDQILQQFLGKNTEILFLIKPGGKKELLKIIGNLFILALVSYFFSESCQRPEQAILEKETLMNELFPQDCAKFLIPFTTCKSIQIALNKITRSFSHFTGKES